nr:hypothetical protein [Tanacetum cinerariifolium]
QQVVLEPPGPICRPSRPKESGAAQ